MRLAALLFAAILGSSAGTNDVAMSLLRDWIAMVDLHSPGEHDAAITALSEWSLADLDLMQAYVNALTDVPRHSTARDRRRSTISTNDLHVIRNRMQDLQRRGDFDRFRIRAALLHTDAAMFGSFKMTVAQPPPPGVTRYRPSRRVDVLSHDGEVKQYQMANPHWEYARELLDALPKIPERDPVVARWYRAIGAHFMRQRAFAEALDHFEAARAVAAGDPGVLYGEACLEEIFGSPRIQDYVRVTSKTGVFIRGVSSSQSHFRKAADLLRKALAAQPGFVEARLRLGRLLVEQKQPAEALTHLQEVVSGPEAANLHYFAHVFSGDALIALDRPSDARTAYERALDLFPSAQAAHLGLATSLRLMGDRQSAAAAVLSTVTLAAGTRDEEDEPWWDYYDGDAAGVERLLAELRAPYLGSRK
jgi:tetratricopeptide (TPR) repeat protein